MSEEIKITPYPARVIRRVEEFIVNNVGKVAVLTATDPSQAQLASEEVVRYQGFAVLGARLQNGQVMQIPVEFELNVKSVEEAFDNFQQAATDQMRKQMDEARRAADAEAKKIITAPSGSVPNIKVAQ